MKSNDNKFYDLCFKKVFFFIFLLEIVYILFVLEWLMKFYKIWSLLIVDLIIFYLKIVLKCYFDICFNRFK